MEFNRFVSETEKASHSIQKLVMSPHYETMEDILTSDLVIDVEAALHLAVRYNKLEPVRIMFPYLVNKNKHNLLYTACLHASLRMTKFIIQNSIDININNQNENGFTALHCAILKGNARIVKYLIQNNANIDIFDYKNRTPLYLACKIGNYEIVSIILNHNNAVNYACEKGRHPLHIAVGESRLDIVQLLLEHGADVNAFDYKGQSTLYYCDNTIILERLLINGADVNNVNYEGNLPACCLGERATILNHERIGACMDIYIKHISKLKILGFYIHPINDMFLSDSFDVELNNEIAIMKDILLNTFTSLYDIIFISENNLAKFANNKRFSNLYKECMGNFVYVFKNFGYLLNMQIEKAYRRRELENDAKKVLIFNLPDLCINKIISNLSNNDLKMIR